MKCSDCGRREGQVPVIDDHVTQTIHKVCRRCFVLNYQPWKVTSGKEKQVKRIEDS